MNIDHLKKVAEEQDGLSKTLGITFFSTPEPDTVMAKMPVDSRNKQVFGFLSGGASLALAENLAGVGSMALCPGKVCVGINVSGSHVKAVRNGSTVTAYAYLRHKGTTLHQWQVDLRNDDGELISTVMVTNYVIRPTRQKA